MTANASGCAGARLARLYIGKANVAMGNDALEDGEVMLKGLKKLVLALLLMVAPWCAQATPVTVYGLVLGEKLLLPECAAGVDLKTVGARCMRAQGGAARRVGVVDASEVLIAFPKNETPMGSRDNTLTGYLDAGGHLVRLEVATGDKVSPFELVALLSGKLGAPAATFQKEDFIYVVWGGLSGRDVVYFSSYLRSGGRGTLVLISGRVYGAQVAGRQGTPL